MTGQVGPFDPRPGLGLQSDGALVYSLEIPPNAQAGTMHLVRATLARQKLAYPECTHTVLRYRAPKWWRWRGRWHRWTCVTCALEIRVLVGPNRGG